MKPLPLLISTSVKWHDDGAGPPAPPIQQIIISFDPPSSLPSCEPDQVSRHSQILLCLDVNYEINQIFGVVLFIIRTSLCHTCKLYSNQYLKYLHILSVRNKISNSLHQSPPLISATNSLSQPRGRQAAIDPDNVLCSVEVSGLK